MATLIRQVRARKAESGGSVPAIALTGYAAWEDRDRVLSAGYQIHLVKPVEADDLVRAVATLAGHQPQAPQVRR